MVGTFLGSRAAVLLGGGNRLTAQQRALRYGLVSAWNLEEASGARADAYGSNSLSDNNSTLNADGRASPRAAAFVNASSQSLSITDNASVSMGDVDAWGCAWVYLDSNSADRTILGQYLTTGNQRAYACFYQKSTNRFALKVSGDGTATTTVSTSIFGGPSLGTWNLVVWYHDSTNDLIGIAVNLAGAYNTAAHSAGIFDSSAAFRIGAEDLPGVYMDGRIDGVCLAKSPPLGIGVLKDEIREYAWNKGVGRTWPW